MPSLQNDTCAGILDEFGYLSMSDFVKFNPAVKSDCSGLWANTYYCVYDYASSSTPFPPTVSKAPSSLPSGIASNCTSWYQATVGDDCDVIPQMFGTFSKSAFVGWNPAVKSDCSGIQVNLSPPACTFNKSNNIYRRARGIVWPCRAHPRPGQQRSPPQPSRLALVSLPLCLQLQGLRCRSRSPSPRSAVLRLHRSLPQPPPRPAWLRDVAGSTLRSRETDATILRTLQESRLSGLHPLLL